MLIGFKMVANLMVMVYTYYCSSTAGHVSVHVGILRNSLTQRKCWQLPGVYLQLQVTNKFCLFCPFYSVWSPQSVNSCIFSCKTFLALKPKRKPSVICSDQFYFCVLCLNLMWSREQGNTVSLELF